MTSPVALSSVGIDVCRFAVPVVSSLTGVRGRLIDLIDPTQKKFEVAICSALGRHMNSVVVDTGDTCKECMVHLTEHQKPRMTFLALDKLIVKEPTDEIRAMMGA